MINEQTNKIIDIIKTVDEKDKLRFAIALCDSVFSNVNFDKKEILIRFSIIQLTNANNSSIIALRM